MLTEAVILSLLLLSVFVSLCLLSVFVSALCLCLCICSLSHLCTHISCLHIYYWTMFTSFWMNEISSWALTFRYTIKDLYIMNELDVKYIINNLTFTAINVTSNKMSNLTDIINHLSEFTANNLTFTTVDDINNITFNAVIFNSESITTDSCISAAETNAVILNHEFTATDSHISAVIFNPESTVTDSDDFNKLLKNMSSNITHELISHWNEWLQCNSHRQFTAENLMSIISEMIKKVQLTLINLYWRDNNIEREVSFTDRERVKWEYLIWYLLNVCKFIMIQQLFILYNLLSSVADCLLSDSLIKLTKNVNLTQISCSIISDRQKTKT